MKKYCLLSLMLLLSIAVHAQRSNFSVTPTIGITSPLLDNGFGLHVGVNPAYKINPWIAVEGQVSYIRTKINSSFIAGNDGLYNSVNTLIGGRVYLNAEKHNTRFYINLLVGGNYLREKSNNLKRDAEFGFGFSGGAFFEHKRFLIGVSYDTPQNMVIKMGLVF